MSRSLLAISSRLASWLFRSRSRLLSSAVTRALSVLALPSASAASALSTSARARSSCASWLITVARLDSRSAWAWSTRAWKSSGSRRAITWPRSTRVLKSASNSLIWPDT